MVNDVYRVADIESTLQPKIKEIIKQSKDIIESSLYDHFIIRCDAGASRSQALGTALTNYYTDIKFNRNILDGNIVLLQLFEKELGISKTREQYKQMLIKTWNRIINDDVMNSVFQDIEYKVMDYDDYLFKEK